MRLNVQVIDQHGANGGGSEGLIPLFEKIKPHSRHIWLPTARLRHLEE